ncbi:MAG: PepSY domain-containing protein [Lachnospiraceae bacterium]|nr:PepSY domain-containing protein [Lachnospiraceae bacterium]
MKKQRLFTLIILSIFALSILTGCTSSKDQTTERTQSVNVNDQESNTTLSTDGDWDEDDNHSNQTASTADLLSKEKIRSIVEKHTTELKGKDMQIKLDSDDGINVYEVDARTSTHEFEFEINAISGDILSYGKELIQPKNQTNSSASIISETKVRSIVEKYTTELKGKDMIIERDSSDGVKVYEVEATTLTHKYEFEIDAYTGEVISYDEEVVNK